MPATHMTEEQEEAQKHGFMHPAYPNMADQTGAKCCNATPDPFEMFSGGLANPITYVEQLFYLLYLKLLDEAENQHTQAEVTKEGLPATAFSHVVHRKMLR